MRDSVRVVLSLACALALSACSKDPDAGRAAFDEAMSDAQAWMEAEVAIAELGDKIGVAVLSHDAHTNVSEIEYHYESETARPVSGLACALLGYYTDQRLAPQPGEQITLVDRHICVAPSETREMGAGMTISFDALIERAVASLDPTAASHLLTHPDRDALAGQWKIVFTDPRNDPLMAPSEIERVKLAPLATQREEFEQADPDERRRLLSTEIPARPAVAEMYEIWVRPVSVETVGHFSNPVRLANVVRSMDDSILEVPNRPTSRALGSLPPIPGFESSWSIAAGEPGVIAWVGAVRTSTNMRYTIVVLAHDAEEPLDTQLVSAAIGAVLDALHQIAAD